jgi:hypothetical protein
MEDLEPSAPVGEESEESESKPMSEEEAAQALMDCGASTPEEFLAKAKELGFSFSGGAEEPADEEEEDEEPMPPGGAPDVMLVLSKKRKGAAGKALKKHGY